MWESLLLRGNWASGVLMCIFECRAAQFGLKSCWDYVDRLQMQNKYLNISHSFCLYIKAKRIKGITSFWSSSHVQQGVKHSNLANDAFCLQIKFFCSRSAANKRVSLKGVHQGTKLTSTPPAIMRLYIYIYIYICIYTVYINRIHILFIYFTTVNLCFFM